MNKNIIDYIDKIRNGILHDKISTDIPNYRLLCSALDIVSDAEDGIYSYLNLKMKMVEVLITYIVMELYLWQKLKPMQ